MFVLGVGRETVSDRDVDGGRCCAGSVTADIISEFVYCRVDIGNVVIAHGDIRSVYDQLFVHSILFIFKFLL